MTPDDNLIDEALHRMPAWEPSPRFAEAVAARAGALVRQQPVAPRWWSFAGAIRALAAGIVTAITAYLAASFIGQLGSSVALVAVPTPQGMGVWVAASYVFAAWFVRRYQASG